MSTRMRPGVIGAALIAVVYGAIALWGDYPSKAGGTWGDEATYYMLAHSIVRDRDFAYRTVDLVRTKKELGPNGPNGVFLKVGQDVTGVHVESNAPFVKIDGREDPESSSRLFYGKSFIYPLMAAPFVGVFGTNGFLVFNTLLLIAVFLAAYAFLAARSPVAVALVFAFVFVFATVTPVYWAWITPELFNCAIGALAYFCWLYKLVATGPPARGFAWLRGRESDAVAGVLIGIATFSKVTNVLWLLPMVAWWLVQREWRRAAVVSLCWGALTVGLFAINVAVIGDWNYQGGQRKTFVSEFPFEKPGVTFHSIERGDMSRSDSLAGILFEPRMFWSNLRANVQYYFVGRYAGLVPYFAPAVFATLFLLIWWRKAASWQWFILAGVIVQMFASIITQPYTWIGDGGSIGNRYFTSGYGLWVFLMPPLQSIVWAAVPGIVGALFVAPMVFRPFSNSLLPFVHADSGPARLLSPELTNVNGLPLMTQQDLRKRDFDRDQQDGRAHFQFYYLDANLGLPEQEVPGPGKPWSVWVFGERSAEVILKVNPPMRLLKLLLSSGPVATTATVKFCGITSIVELPAHTSKELNLPVCEGFPYRNKEQGPQDTPHLVWVLSVSSSAGFRPRDYERNSSDERYLGVRVTPSMSR